MNKKKEKVALESKSIQILASLELFTSMTKKKFFYLDFFITRESLNLSVLNLNE